MKENTEKKLNLNLFAGIYFLLFFVSVVFNDEKPYLKFPKLGDTFMMTMLYDLGLGVVIGAVVVVLTRLLSKLGSFRHLVDGFQDLFGDLSLTEIFFIASFSSLAEEFFFRGLVQGNFGIVFASILFGVLHTGPGKKYVPWTIFGIVMGFVLGGIYEWRQNLAVPVVIHFVVNFANLFFFIKRKVPAVKPTEIQTE